MLFTIGSFSVDSERITNTDYGFSLLMWFIEQTKKDIEERDREIKELRSQRDNLRGKLSELKKENKRHQRSKRSVGVGSFQGSSRFSTVTLKTLIGEYLVLEAEKEIKDEEIGRLKWVNEKLEKRIGLAVQRRENRRDARLTRGGQNRGKRSFSTPPR